jgi:serine/threonine protein kinase/Tfp pilus assembly protein PilF
MIGHVIYHYKILEKLGEGGMGVVYKAEDTKLKRIVALKFLPPHFSADDEVKQRFIHEAQAASALNHTNICSIHTIEEFESPAYTDASAPARLVESVMAGGGKQQFIDMEFVEGKTLGVLLKEKELSLKEVMDIALQVAEGLNAAHKKGIVHRDIKPDNIMVTDENLVKIMDFGLAKLKGSSKLTKTHSTLGTLSYMSPEQARGEEVDQRSDIFSLGAVLYEMITGRRPFKGEHEAAIIYSLLNETPEPLARYKSGVPDEIQRVIDKALAKEKDKRYQHVDEMAADLRSALPSLSSHIVTASRRSKVLWIVAAGVVVLMVAGIYLFYPKSGPKPAISKSVAVLPFKNLSDSKEDEYFSDGITDDIIAQLSKITDLKVISRTSVMQYKGISKNIRDIGRELDVATVLEGSVRRSGNQIRIVAQLIDANNEGHLWADTYDKEMTQVFAIQSDVAQRIAAALEAKLSPVEKGRIEKKQTGNTEAYQLYLKGRFYWNKRQLDDIKTAIECFKKAIEKDLDYALAYAGLASAQVLVPSYGVPIGEWYTNAQNTAVKALEIDSTLAEAHTVLGEIAQDHYFDWAGAEKHFRRAIELDPGYPTAHQWYSSTLSFLGRFDEALSEAKRAQELDPLSLVINMNLGDALYVMRQYDRAIEQYKNTLALDRSFPWPHSGLGSIYQVQGKFNESIAEYQQADSLGGSIPYTLVPLGWIYARAGRKADALRVLEELLRLAQHGNSVSYGIAFLYYELGEKDKAFEWFEKAYQDRDIWLESLGTDPLWDNLRLDPKCIALLKKMGLRK